MAFVDDLNAWVEGRPECGRRHSLAEFNAVQGDVKSAVEAGFSAVMIWGKLKEDGRFSYSYDSFRRHVVALKSSGK